MVTTMFKLTYAKLSSSYTLQAQGDFVSKLEKFTVEKEYGRLLTLVVGNLSLRCSTISFIVIDDLPHKKPVC